MKPLLTTLTALLLSALCVAQPPICHIEEYNMDDGLPQDIITEILQDKKGFMWVATRSGLNKFDGYTFKNFKASPHKENTLSNNRIIHILETKYGDIWCHAYDSRAYLFDTHHETFVDVLKLKENEIKRSNIVQKIITLPKGITWIICDKGYCYRVDDKEYRKETGVTLYSTFNGDLKGENIYTIYQDSEGDEWILSDKGISIIGKKQINNDFPFKHMIEVEETIYLLSVSDQLAHYDRQTGNIKFVELPAGVRKVNALSALKSGQPVLCTDAGIVIYEPATSTSRLIDIRTATQPSAEATSVYEDKENELWVYSTAPGIMRIDPQSGEKQHLFTPEKKAVQYERENKQFVFEDLQGTLWTLPLKGNFSYYDRKNKRLAEFYIDPEKDQTPFAPLIRYHCQDAQGNSWLTSVRGMYKMSFYPQTYEMVHFDKGFDVRALLLDSQQRLWIATKSGYIRIYNPDGTLNGYLTPGGIISKTPVPFVGNVYCLNEDKDGTIWAGTKLFGLARLTKKSAQAFHLTWYTHQADDPYSLSHNDIFSIYIDSRDNIWLATYGGGLNLLRQSAEGKVSFINHRNKLKNFPISRFHNTRCIAETDSGVILIGTTYGLLSFSNTFDQAEEIKFYCNSPDGSKTSGLLSSDVLYVYVSREKNIYVLTFTGGINKITSGNLLSEEIAFTHYTEKEGLSSDLVLSMIADRNGDLWIVSENALSKFNESTGTFEDYNTRFLRQKFNFTEAIPTINAQGQIIFGTDIGILEVIPEQMKKSSYAPAIVFTNLRINGKDSPTSVDNYAEIPLQPSERNISIRFSALDFMRPEDIRYAYQLEGLEKEWNYSDKNRQASYINLPAGNYKLNVKSTNSDGVWVDNMRTLPIRVLPTFWETPWAWLLYLVAFILFTATIVYVLFYIYRLRHRVDMEHQLADIKLRFFTDISHELRTPLTLIATPVTEVLENEPLSPTAREHLSVVRKNTDRMLRLINQILDFRKIQNRKMKLLLEETELVAFLMKITESFRSIAEEKQINFTLEAEEEELYVWLDRDKVEKIMFNLLGNAFKYTLPGKSVTIVVKREEKDIRISVIDEGVGIAAEKLSSLFKRFETLSKANMLQPSSGIGLSLAKELIEMHYGSIAVKSQPGTGSDFSITLPLDREVYKQDPQAELILADAAEKEKQPAPTPITLPADEEGQADERLSILVVEDNDELRSLLRNILQKQYLVIEATNGEEGLALAAEAIPDMIISDIMMPVMDGLEMVGQIKANKDIRHIPLILLSSKSSLEDRITGLEQGIDDYITKPFSSTYLKTKIAALFTQRKQLQEMFVNSLSNREADRPETSNEWEPVKPKVIPHDEQFMAQVMAFLEEQMDNPDLVIDDFANKLLLSRTIFYRKLKSIVGLTPVDFIREIRLKRAMQLIESGTYNFSQIAYMTGFSDPKYFSKCFKKFAGVTPKEYKESAIAPPS